MVTMPTGELQRAPLQGEQDFAKRQEGFTALFKDPRLIAALLQTGTNLLQGGGAGEAIAEGFGAAGRVQTGQDEAAKLAVEQGQADRRIAVEEGGLEERVRANVARQEGLDKDRDVRVSEGKANRAIEIQANKISRLRLQLERDAQNERVRQNDAGFIERLIAKRQAMETAQKKLAADLAKEMQSTRSDIIQTVLKAHIEGLPVGEKPDMNFVMRESQRLIDQVRGARVTGPTVTEGATGQTGGPRIEVPPPSPTGAPIPPRRPSEAERFPAFSDPGPDATPLDRARVQRQEILRKGELAPIDQESITARSARLRSKLILAKRLGNRQAEEAIAEELRQLFADIAGAQ